MCSYVSLEISWSIMPRLSSSKGQIWILFHVAGNVFLPTWTLLCPRKGFAACPLSFPSYDASFLAMSFSLQAYSSIPSYISFFFIYLFFKFFPSVLFYSLPSFHQVLPNSYLYTLFLFGLFPFLPGYVTPLFSPYALNVLFAVSKSLCPPQLFYKPHSIPASHFFSQFLICFFHVLLVQFWGSDRADKTCERMR